MTEPTGFEIWRGPSRINGDPIVAIVTLGSKNMKTGAMWQLWILAQAVKPGEARRTGQDEAVCGSCVHRPLGGQGTCYVSMWAPSSVWATWKRGLYPVATPMDRLVLRNGKGRLGAYGDPMALSWQTLRGIAPKFRTGYTHQWRRSGSNHRYKEFLMASCDTREEAVEAQRLGWRVFLVVPRKDEIPPGFAHCPSDELFPGNKIPCEDCGACSGGHGNNIAIYAHGSVGKRYEPGRPNSTKPFVEAPKYPGLVRMDKVLMAAAKAHAKEQKKTLSKYVSELVKQDLEKSA